VHHAAVTSVNWCWQTLKLLLAVLLDTCASAVQKALQHAALAVTWPSVLPCCCFTKLLEAAPAAASHAAAAAAAAAGSLLGLGLRLGELGWQRWRGDEPRLAQQAGYSLRGVRANSKPVPEHPTRQRVKEQREQWQ
jgi:hypothetical protein